MAKKSDKLKESLTHQEDKDAPIFFTTGCTLLDLNIGGGVGMGFKGGALVNLVAIEGAGKTQLAAESCAHNLHKTPGFWNYYLDREHRFSFDTMGMWGVQIVDPDIECPETIEAADGRIGNVIDEATSPGMIILDSLDAFSTIETEKRADQRMEQDDANKDIKQDGSYTISTGTPKFFSESLRIRMSQASKKNITLLFLSQVRAKLNAMQFDPNKFNRNGGKALDHWCNDVIWLKPIKYISVGKKEDYTERDIGVVVKAWTTKSSNPRPYRECFYTIFFDSGIDNIGSNLDFLFNLRDCKTQELDKERCNKIKWDGGTELTLSSAKEWLATHSTDSMDLMGLYQGWLKEKTNSKVFRLDMLEEWMESATPQGTPAIFKAEFASEVSTRDQLIARLLESPEMAKELEQRVITKWNAIETQASSFATRPRKFG